MVAQSSPWDWAAISPENQARIMTGAIGTAEEARRSAEQPADIALKQAQAAYALQHAGILPTTAGADMMRARSGQVTAQADMIRANVAQALQASQQAENEARATGNNALADYHKQQSNQLQMINEAANSIVDPEARREAILGLKGKGLTGDARSERATRAKAISAAKGISLDRAWDIVNKQDEETYVKETSELLLKNLQITFDDLPAVKEKLRKQWRDEHATELTPHGPVSAPTDFNYYKKRP